MFDRLNCLRRHFVKYVFLRTSPLTSNELLKQLNWLPIESLNGAYGLNLLLGPSMPCTHWSPDISLWLLQHHEPTRSLRSFSSHQLSIPRCNSTLISWFSVFHSKSLKFITCQHPCISVTSYFQTSSKDILFSVSLLPFSCPSCLEYLCPRALILLRLWRYTSHAHSYLLTSDNVFLCYYDHKYRFACLK